MIYRILICIIVLLGIYQLVTHFYRDEEKELRTQVRTAVKEAFPDHQEEYAKTIGLFRYKAKPGTGGEPPLKEKAVVLIHGLDDPGKVWQNLRPALIQGGYDVWQFEYPNDQPLAESAEMLFQQLQDLKTHQINHISIVAHSMGGLVARHAILQNVYVDQQDYIQLFVTISTPWGGHRAAAKGVQYAPAVVPSWRDMVPESDFLSGLYRRPG